MQKIKTVDYVFKTVPFGHQKRAFLTYRDNECSALLHEQGTGKTKTILDIAAWKYQRGDINALVVLAPNGVHVNWIKNEIPVHLPDHIERVTAWWRANPKAKEKKALSDLYEVNKNGLRIFTMNAEAVSTVKGQKFLKDFLIYNKCLLVLDESQRFSTPGAKRTKFIINAARHTVARIIATGTSMSQGPLNLYAQYKFLDPTIIGYTTYTAFKNEFAVWERRTLRNERGHYNHLVSYKNLDKLAALIRPYTDRVLKKDCLDLPEKLYTTVYVTLTATQRRFYNTMVEESLVTLREEYRTQTGVSAPQSDPESELLFFLTNPDVPTVIAKHAASKRLKLMQISSGFLIDDKKEVHEIDGGNPKLNALLEALEDYEGKVIVWAWFRHEIKMLEKTLKEKYGSDSTVSYYGGTTVDEKEENRDRFVNDDKCRYFIGQPISAGTGLTFIVSSMSVYYTRVPYEARLQSEDRNHRIGQVNNVLYLDLIAQDTVEEKAVELFAKQDKVINQVYDLLEEK